MNFRQMLEEIKKVKDAILNGDFAEAWKLTLPLQERFIEFAQDLGFRSSPEDQKHAKELEKELKECAEACDKAPKSATGDNEPKSKIGDGKILKMLFEMFLKFAPLFFKADPNQPVNENEEQNGGSEKQPEPREGTREAKARANPANPTANPDTAEKPDTKDNATPKLK